MKIVDTVFRLGSASLRLTTHPLKFRAQKIPDLGEFGRKVLVTLVALAQIIVVIPVIGIDMSAVDLYYLVTTVRVNRPL